MELTQKKTISRGRALGVFLTTFLVFLLLFGAGVFLWSHLPQPPLSWAQGFSCFRIEGVKVVSDWPIAAETVRSWLPPLEGRSLITVSPGDIATVLRAKPWVESVTVRKEYPNRLLIEVSARHAQAMMLQKGHPYFIDSAGGRIDLATPELFGALDLPMISFEPELERGADPLGGWNLPTVLRTLDGLQRALASPYAVSQIVLGTPPYFRVFLSSPKVEVALDATNWEGQLPILALLLHSPPRQIGQPQRINLLFPKKAVVSP